MARGLLPSRRLLWQLTCNVACSAFFVWVGYRHTKLADRSVLSVEGLVAIGCFGLALLTLTRSPATASVGRPLVIVLVGYSKTYYLLLDLFAESSQEMLLMGAGLSTAGLAGWLATAFTLGRSFSILPALRAVRTRGPYAVVRHPMYASYMLIDVGLLLSFLSVRNVLVIIGAALSYVLRAMLEEDILQRDAQYRAYMMRTRFRFVPGVY